MKDSDLFDETEYKRWLHQAEYTLNSAKGDLKSTDYSWSCFKSQQAAEYAVKAILRGLGKAATGHSVLKLLEKLEETGISVPEGLRNCARSLDKHYVPPRYPNAYPAGAPFEFYDKTTAKEAISHANKVVQFVLSEKAKYV